MQKIKAMKHLYNLLFCVSLCTFAAIHASEDVQRECEIIRRDIAVKLIAARQKALENHVAREYSYSPINSDMEFFLIINKNAFLNAPKYFVQKGVSTHDTVQFDATMDCANLMAHRRAIFIGNGLIKNSFSGALTILEGDFIIESSIFHGDTLVQKDSSVKADSSLVSYTGCFLDHLCVRNNHTVVIELRDTVVTGDIIFDHPGIVVIDKKTVLKGNISNARLMMAKD